MKRCSSVLLVLAKTTVPAAALIIGLIGPRALHAETPVSNKPNPVQLEMRELATAMQATLVAIANNDLRAVTPAIHKVHGARDVTAQALARGEYKPPKNSDKVKEFVQEDDAFHDELVKLVRAAKANDLVAASHQIGVVVEGCTKCHLKYRF